MVKSSKTDRPKSKSDSKDSITKKKQYKKTSFNPISINFIAPKDGHGATYCNGNGTYHFQGLFRCFGVFDGSHKRWKIDEGMESRVKRILEDCCEGMTEKTGDDSSESSEEEVVSKKAEPKKKKKVELKKKVEPKKKKVEPKKKVEQKKKAEPKEDSATNKKTKTKNGKPEEKLVSRKKNISPKKKKEDDSDSDIEFE